MRITHHPGGNTYSMPFSGGFETELSHEWLYLFESISRYSTVSIQVDITDHLYTTLLSSNGQCVESSLDNPPERPQLCFLVCCSLLSLFSTPFYPSSSSAVSHLCIKRCGESKLSLHTLLLRLSSISSPLSPPT